MGDYGFKGAGEFSGEDTNLNTLPDHHFTKCPHRELGLRGDADNEYGCLATGSPHADHSGFGYDLCNIVGHDYSKCQRYMDSLKVKK